MNKGHGGTVKAQRDIDLIRWERGWSKLPNGIRDTWIMREPKALLLLMYYLTRANHKSAAVPGASGPMQIEAGQFVVSRPKIIEDTGFTEKAIRTADRKLEEGGYIERNVVRRGGKRASSATVITVLIARACEEHFADEGRTTGQTKGGQLGGQRADNWADKGRTTGRTKGGQLVGQRAGEKNQKN